MTFNVWTFLFEILNFLVLAFVLHRLLYRPLREAIDKRKAENERAKTDAESARKKTDATKHELVTKVAELDRERTDVLRTATEQAEAEKTKRLAQADTAAKGVREQAQHDADRLREDTIRALEGEIGKLAVGLAERLLTQACDVSLNEQFTRHLSDTVRGVTGDEREQVRRDAGADEAVLESATALSDASRGQLTVAIHELLGRDAAVKFEVNSALVGGARVRVGGHVWDATVAAQLEAAKTALNGKGDVRPG